RRAPGEGQGCRTVSRSRHRSRRCVVVLESPKLYAMLAEKALRCGGGSHLFDIFSEIQAWNPHAMAPGPTNIFFLSRILNMTKKRLKRRGSVDGACPSSYELSGQYCCVCLASGEN